MYPNPKIAQFISEHFIPVRQHVKTHPEAMQRFDAQWTPTLIAFDPDGKERHRVEGFLDADALLAQLQLALGKIAFDNQQWDDAERWFEEAAKSGDPDVAPEAAYWAGVTRYKRSGDASELGKTYQRLNGEFAGTTWAKKASVWAA